MKHHTVILVMLMALAGCSATYTGDSKSFNKLDSANHGRYIVSKEGAATLKQSQSSWIPKGSLILSPRTQWDDLFVVYWSTRSWLF
jgi:uncharacterized protein YceK